MTDQIVRLGPEYFPRATSGVPISGGSIYIGDPDTDPEIPGNQITVNALQENGTTVPISQPILTSGGGVPLYNGAPVTLLVSESYSCKVLDAFGVQVYYVPSITVPIVIEGDNVIYLKDIISLINITTPADGDTYSVVSFFDEKNKGGDDFFWSSLVDKSLADGGYYSDPDNIGGFDGTVGTLDSYLTTQGTGVGFGCWVRKTALSKIYDYGALADGTDDFNALYAAISSGRSLDFGDDVDYISTEELDTTYTESVTWYGTGATITYDPVTHTENFISVNMTTQSLDFKIGNILFDGASLCNKVLEITNQTNFYGNLLLDGTRAQNAHRIITFSGGEGIRVKGAFNLISFINDAGVNDCKLGTGAGIPGTIGIAGITVEPFSLTSFPKKVIFNGARIEKVYSEDLTYTTDQDGIKVFAPHTATGSDGEFLPAEMHVIRSTFKNCYGRSIKSQVFVNIVKDNLITRDEGLTRGYGNNEIDIQISGASVKDNTFEYKNGQTGDACVNLIGGSSGADYGTPSSAVKDNQVYLESGTVLPLFARTFPNNKHLGTIQMKGNKIFGTTQRFVDYLCNGDENRLTVEDNYVGDIADYDIGGSVTKAFIYVLTSGSDSPFDAEITAMRNVCGNPATQPAIARDFIVGTQIWATVSAYGNINFIDDGAVIPSFAGLKTGQASMIGRIGAALNDGGGSATFEVKTRLIASGATETFDLRSLSTALVFFNVTFNNTAYAFFSAGSATNIVINAGAAVNVGDAVDPGSGTFRIWTSANNELSVRNTDGSGRTVGLYIMSPG